MIGERRAEEAVGPLLGEGSCLGEVDRHAGVADGERGEQLSDESGLPATAGPASAFTSARAARPRNRDARFARNRRDWHAGITRDTIACVAMTLRLTDEETEALRLRAEHEGASMQEVARAAVREYIERASSRELLDRVLDEQLPRYAEALRRLGE